MKNFFARIISLVLVLSVLMTFVPSFDVFAADNGVGTYVVNVSTSLNMRSGPGTGYDKLDKLYNGTVVTVTQTSNGWGKITYNGQTGWISLEYAEFCPTGAPAASTTTGNQREDIVSIALGELGYHEGSNNYTKYGVWYSTATHNAPWCAIFVCWCANQAGISESIIPKFSFCYTGITLFTRLGVWCDKSTYIPQTGDIIFFRSDSATSASDHVGIVVSCDGTKVYTIEGNSSDAVSKRTYNLTDGYIVGYASPNYLKPVTTTTTTTTTTTESTTTTTTTTSTEETTSTTVTTSTDVTSTTNSTEETSTTTTTTTTAADTSVRGTLTVTGGTVNVRSGAGTEYSRVTTVRKGQTFAVLGSGSDSTGKVWYKISVNGREGYISSVYSVVSETAATTTTRPTSQPSENGGDVPAAATGYVIVTGSVVNVRKGAGTSYAKFSKSASKGSVFPCLGTETVSGVKWYKIEYEGSVGYISGDYSKPVTTVKVTGAVVNVRSGAGTSCSKLTSVKRGSTYQLLGSKKASDGVVWYCISINGQTGYICGTYTSLS